MKNNYGIEQVYITPVTGMSIPAGEYVNLSEEPIPVWEYSTIRITAGARVSNQSIITINIITAIPYRDDWVRFATIESFTLEPHEGKSFTLDVPAQNIFITAHASEGQGSSDLFLVLFGYKPLMIDEPKPRCC